MQKESKEKIKKLVEKYEKVRSAGKVRFYTEEETKNGFIKPLFEALGWDFSNKDEVSAEETISGQRVDYGFYIDGRIKFYLETKKLSADIHREDFANQAIKYSWNKGATWAILTDFENLIVFNAQDIDKKIADKLFFEIPCSKYLERFDQLYLLSKKAIKDDLLDKEAEKYGKKFQKIPVTSLLYKDFQKCRDILTSELGQMNSKIGADLLDEGVQKLLDRLIFMRVAEDRGIEPATLIPLVRQARSGGKKLYESMIGKFREFDDFYNSNLFQPHSFEQWEEYTGATERVIKILYGKAGYYEYDFKAMPADVLGAVYESYLGHRLSQSKKGATIAKDAKKRKEHGIYYTPSFIVDYIVKNALGPVLDKCKDVESLKKIRVLDPACGSGSFLIKALDLITKKHKEFGAKNEDENLVKIQILENNIYGVDLDQQAVEITRLNLLINTLNERMKLPLLDNIKNGNFLISGTDEELKKYFGKNFKEKEPFNWEEKFPEVFKQGGFDVIIGNPPWGAEIEELDKKYYKDLFQSGIGIIDTFALFIEKSFSLLKENGYLGFILPDIVLLKNYPQIRKLILDNSVISDTYYTGMAFHDVNLDSVIMVFKKEKNEQKRNKNIINVIVNDGNKKIEQKLFYENRDYKFNLYFDKQNIELKKKMDLSSVKLGELLEIHEGIHSGNIREKLFVDSSISSNCKKLLFKGVEINRYSEKWNGKYVNYDRSIIKKNKNEYANLGKEEYFINNKILVRRTGDKILATLDEAKYFTSNNFFVLYRKEKSDLNLKYILAILNSNIGTWYFLAIQPRRGKLFAEIKINHLAEIPIFKIDFSDKKEEAKHDEIVKSVDKMLKLNRELQKITENSEKWKSIKSEIEKTDKKIDEEVYKLYDLTSEEVKIIENKANNGCV